MKVDPSDRIARIEQGVDDYGSFKPFAVAALADLRAWVDIAHRHQHCRRPPAFPCRDYQAADAAIGRLDALWGMT